MIQWRFEMRDNERCDFSFIL